ncbi:MAG: kelch repeat-containing protein [Flavobacteriales bacterium]
MKQFYSLALSVFLILPAMAQQWTEVASLPLGGERHHPITFTLNGTGYSLMGSDSNDFPRAESYKYDPTSDEWTQIANFPGLPRGFSYAVTDEEFAYLGFGLNGESNTVLDDLWKFDPVTEEWTELSSCPCTARFHPAMILVEGKIFMGAGGSAFGNLRDWWEYDIVSDSWTEKQEIPGAVRHHPFYFGLNGDAYVGFGHGNNLGGSLQVFNDFYRWNVDTENWTILDDFPGEARVAGTQFSHDGFGYVLSGDGDDHDFMDEGEFWQYNPDSESWSQLPSHPGFSRWAPGSFIIDGEVYFAQGQERFNQFPFSEISRSVLKFDLDLYNSPFSVNEFSEEQTLSIYPNPASDQIQFSIDGNTLPNLVRVIDFTGRTVLEISDFTQSISLTGLSAGTYVLEAVTDKGLIHGRFIKE